MDNMACNCGCETKKPIAKKKVIAAKKKIKKK